MEDILNEIPTYAYHFLIKALYQIQGVVKPTIQSLATRNPDLVSVAVLVIVLYVSLLILNEASKWIFRLIGAIFKLVILAGIVWFAWQALNNGLDQATQETVNAASTVLKSFDKSSSSSHRQFYGGKNNNRWKWT